MIEKNYHQHNKEESDILWNALLKGVAIGTMIVLSFCLGVALCILFL